jgi:hypothetical protein
VKQLYFSKNTFGKNFTLELNGDDTFSLFSILEFVHRESGENGVMSKRISPQEISLAKKLSDDIEPYIDELEYEVK